MIAVHPNQVKAMRPRYSVANGKSEGFDSFVLAELARTDSHRFRVLVPDSDGTKALRALTRARDRSSAPGLRWPTSCATSWRSWPGASKVFCAVDSKRGRVLRLRAREGPPRAVAVVEVDELERAEAG